MHNKARDAARFTILAQEHGKFWEAHDKVFENYRSLGEPTFLKIASELGIPEDEVKKVLSEKSYEDRINADMKEASKYEVNSTPTSFVNGRRVKGAQPYEKFKEAVDAELSSD